MSSVNKAIIVGRLGQDPEVRYTRNGDAVCNLSVATSRRWTDDQGEQRESTEWHRVVVWGNQAEQCGEYLSKGRLVYVEGSIRTEKWQDDQGNDRYTTKIRAYTVRFLGSRDDTQEPGSSGSQHVAGKSEHGTEPPESAQEPMENSDFFNRP